MVIFSYNPKKKVFSSRLGRKIPLKKRLNNFGDLLGPIIVSKLLEGHSAHHRSGKTQKTLFSVGSVLHFAKDGDVIWGAGRNGKVLDELHSFTNLDIRATRGPLTRTFLQNRGFSVPPVYGDPALLLPEIFPGLKDKAEKQQPHIFIPNYNDKQSIKTNIPTVAPTQDPWKVIEAIRTSDFVSSSSLHGIIVAESLGVPCRVVTSCNESPFKYLDYFFGTGREDIDFAASPERAEEMGSHSRMDWSSHDLVSSFPYDLFR